MRVPTSPFRLLVPLLATAAMLVAVTPAGASSHVDVVSEGPRPSLEGVAVDKTGKVFVTSTLTGELLKFAPGSSDFEVFGTIDGWASGGPGAGFLGLATDAKGNVYGAAQWEGFTGVYKFDRKTGDEALIAGTDQMRFPNVIAFDKVGNMYITDSNSTGVFNPIPPGDVPLGAIWRVDRDGNAMKLSRVRLGPHCSVAIGAAPEMMGGCYRVRQSGGFGSSVGRCVR